jgi:hypothetical protein
MTDPLDRLAPVLAQLVDDAGLALLSDVDPSVHRHCVRLYNRLLERVRVAEPELSPEFVPLGESVGAGAVRMRGRDLLVQLSATRSPGWLGAWFERLFATDEPRSYG